MHTRIPFLWTWLLRRISVLLPMILVLYRQPLSLAKQLILSWKPQESTMETWIWPYPLSAEGRWWLGSVLHWFFTECSIRIVSSGQHFTSLDHCKHSCEYSLFGGLRLSIWSSAHLPSLYHRVVNIKRFSMERATVQYIRKGGVMDAMVTQGGTRRVTILYSEYAFKKAYWLRRTITT